MYFRRERQARSIARLGRGADLIDLYENAVATIFLGAMTE